MFFYKNIKKYLSFATRLPFRFSTTRKVWNLQKGKERNVSIVSLKIKDFKEYIPSKPHSENVQESTDLKKKDKRNVSHVSLK
jgi:hypothetical protein